MRHTSQRTRIKICGLSSVEVAVHAAYAGADAIGLVFYSPSPRCVTLAIARAIAQALPVFTTRVALFVDAAAEQVYEVLEQVRPELLQFHGDETPEYCRQFRRPYIKAIRVQEGVNLLQCALDYSDAQGLLLDACVAGEKGGTGAGFDWNLIPSDLPLPLILSGGLTAQNVGAAIQQLQPWAVDVSSGVESARGVKDKDKITEFIAKVADSSELIR